MADSIIILGVGNILKRDEGIGVYIANFLNSHCSFSGNVRIVDGGTLGARLIPLILDCDRLIIIDALIAGKQPGCVSVLRRDDWKNRVRARQSVHELSLNDALALAQSIQKLPEITVIGIEPADIESCEVGLSPEVRESCAQVVDAVCAEVAASGAEVLSRPLTHLPDCLDIILSQM